ncbi:MAG TPA: hypothetical protein ENN34_10480 [Deltaproteobacteria bacterium]|nr:hypothetical protein [Deltaproteobacteria bacterium]
MAKSSLGICWNDIHVQAAVIKAGISEYTIEKMVRIPRECSENNTPKHTVTHDISLLVQELGMTADTRISCLEENQIMYRTVSRPFADRRKIADTIGPEVESLLPIMESRVITDFVMLEKDESGQHLIETISTGFNEVREHITTLQAAGIDPEEIEAPSMALSSGARNLFDLAEGKGYLFLHMDFNDSSLALFSGKRLRYACSFPYGLSTILSAVVREKGCTLTEITQEVRARGIEAGKQLDHYLREVLITLQRFSREEQDPELVPTGYARLITDLPARFEQEGGIHCGMPASRELRHDGSQEELLLNFLSVSLAIRGLDPGGGINLRQQELRSTKKLEKFREYAVKWIRVACILLVLWIFGVGLDVSFKTRISNELSRRIQAEFSSVMPTGTPLVDPIRQMEQYLARMSGKSGRIEKRGKDSTLEMLKDMSVKIPRDIDVVFDTVTIDEENLTISGSTKTYDNVDRIRIALAGIEYITEVKIISANIDKNDQRVKLRLVCKI